MKRCCRCGEVKEGSEFYAHKRTADRLMSWCKDCEKVRQRKVRAARGPRVRTQEQRERGRRRARERYARDRDAIAEKRKRRYWSNPDKYREAAREWRNSNVERARETDRLSSKRRYSEHPERHREKELRRRAAKTGAAGFCTAEQWRGRWDVYGGMCWVCGREAEGMDHVIPLARGGSNWPCNLRPACKSCNSRKGAREWEEYDSGVYGCMLCQMDRFWYFDLELSGRAH